MDEKIVANDLFGSLAAHAEALTSILLLLKQEK